MQERVLLLGVLLLSAIAAGCGDDDGDAGTDTGPRADTGSIDLGSPTDTGPDTDAGGDAGASPEDMGTVADAAPDTDTGAERDAGPAVDAGGEDGGPPMCGSDGLGDFCEDAPCRSGFECMVGRCTPQARQLCGGFAGATCTDPLYPVCLYFSTADFGPCFTRDEAACICDRARTSFACP